MWLKGIVMAKSMKTTGDALKKMLKLGKKRDMPFAFCPSAGDDDNVLIIHRTKKAEMLGKVARKEGEGTKIAFGSFTVKGKVLTLSCERVLPGLAKRMKRHMKMESIPMNVIVLDEDGNELESDIEEMEDDGLLDDGDDDQDVEEDADADAEMDAIAAEEDPNLTPAALAARLKAVQPGVAALGGDLGAKLGKVMQAAVAAIKGGKLDTADTAIAGIEAALERAQPAANGADAGGDSEALVARMTALKPKVQAVEGEAGEKLAAHLGQAVQLLKGGDAAKAGQVLDAIEKALEKLAPAGGEDAAKWEAAAAKLTPAVDATLAAGKGDLSKLRASWALALERAEGGDYAGALKIVPRLAELIKAAGAETQTEAEKEIPDNVVPFVKSRLMWIDTRKKLGDELGKLKSAIDSTLSGIEGMEDVAAQTGTLFDHINGLDNRLEDALEALVEAPDGEKREQLKKTARDIISDYESELDSDFFRDVDGNNGFTPVAVRSTAIDALKSVRSALA